MLRYYYINKEWMLSTTARRVYAVAASFSLLLFCTLIALRVASPLPAPVRPIARLIVLAGVLGTAITEVAMEYFLFGIDQSSAWKKTFWFVVLLFPPLGPSLYYFFVYSRSEMVQRGCPKLAENPLAL